MVDIFGKVQWEIKNIICNNFTVQKDEHWWLFYQFNTFDPIRIPINRILGLLMLL